LSPLSCTYLFDLRSTSQRVVCPWVPISSRCMAFPCIGMLAQSSARGLKEAQDLSTVVSAAIKGAASLGLRWANLDGDQAVPFVDLEVVGIAKGPATSSTLVAELPRLVLR
jgi:hypothetical protein